MECSTLLATMQTSERCSENTPELPANFGRIRGKCCAFFFGAVFREIPLIVFAFFYTTPLRLSKFPRNLWDFWRISDKFPRKLQEFA